MSLPFNWISYLSFRRLFCLQLLADGFLQQWGIRSSHHCHQLSSLEHSTEVLLRSHDSNLFQELASVQGLWECAQGQDPWTPHPWPPVTSLPPPHAPLPSKLPSGQRGVRWGRTRAIGCESLSVASLWLLHPTSIS